MGIHSFFSGVALGIAHESDEAWKMIIAILAHKWSESLTVGVSFVSAEIKTSRAMKFIIFYTLITPLGIFLGYFINKIGNGKVVGVF